MSVSDKFDMTRIFLRYINLHLQYILESGVNWDFQRSWLKISHCLLPLGCPFCFDCRLSYIWKFSSWKPDEDSWVRISLRFFCSPSPLLFVCNLQTVVNAWKVGLELNSSEVSSLAGIIAYKVLYESGVSVKGCKCKNPLVKMANEEKGKRSERKFLQLLNYCESFACESNKFHGWARKIPGKECKHEITYL